MLLALAPAAALAASAPAWISTFPHDPDAYVGIGQADKRQHPVRYREAAQAAALAQISREISVSLRAEESLARREDGLGWEEDWRQAVRADSRNDLSGYRLVDVHETATGFWVYYALDKEEHARVQESRFRARASALESLIAARDLPEALRRLPATGPTPGPASEARDRAEALAERIRSLARQAVLEPDPDGWTWDPAAPGASRAHIRLREGAEGRPWKGSLSLRIRDASEPARVCRVETDAEGGLDPAVPFLDCGLAPGPWWVTWMAPGFAGGAIRVEARIQAQEWSPEVRAEGDGMGPWEDPVSAALTALPSPLWRIRRGTETHPLPVLEVRLLAAEEDSLEGLYFAALRGTLRLPDGTSHAVIGKGGHSDRAKARDRAARDFAAEAGKRLARRP